MLRIVRNVPLLQLFDIQPVVLNHRPVPSVQKRFLLVGVEGLSGLFGGGGDPSREHFPFGQDNVCDVSLSVGCEVFGELLAEGL